MQKILIAALAATLFSCRAGENKEDDSKNSTGKTDAATAPAYTATYSSKFEMGDAKQTDILLNTWKAYDDGNLAASRKYFADSFHVYMRDGGEMNGKTDSVIVSVQGYRNTFSSVKSTVHAIVPVKSSDKNDNWVCIWGTEVSTDKQGKTDSVGLQETWRFNKDGKIDLMYQFGRSLVPPPQPK